MTRVLILDGTLSPETYRPTEGWGQFLCDVDYQGVHLPSGEPVPDLGKFTHLLVSGSEASIEADEPWFDVEAGVIRDAVARGMPVLGSCFGHQMLARTLSGRAYARVAAVSELGWIRLDFLGTDPLLQGIPDPAWCFSSHFDEVRNPPPPWRVLARSERCAVQVMRYGDRPIWGVQAHPEITPPEARMLLEAGAAQFPDRAEVFRRALQEETRDDRFAPRLVANFLKQS